MAGSIATVPAAVAAPGNPGTPSDPTVLFAEDFENVGDEIVLLNEYTGAEGHTYTADEAWLTNCNGVILAFETVGDAPGCADDAGQGAVRQLQWALGSHNGSADPAANHGVSAYTYGNPGANNVEFQTETPITLADARGRFVAFQMNVAAVNCGVSAPQYQFTLMQEDGTASPIGGAANACADGAAISVPAWNDRPERDVLVDTVETGGAIITGATVGIVLRNANGSGTGNDAAFDDMRVLDVTPQLDKSFDPAETTTYTPSRLTFTVTNTSELGAKDGWSFTDTLPEGLAVASTPNIGGTCDANTTAPAGATEIVIANGALAAGETSCTVTVNVVAKTAGTYQNGPENITSSVGLDLPEVSELVVTDPPAFSCQANADGLLFQGNPTNLFSVDLVTGEYTEQQLTPSQHMNAAAYNVKDDFVYAWSITNGAIVRIAADGSITVMGTPTGLAGHSFAVGDIDEEGHYWVIDGEAWFEIDLDPASPTYLTVLRQGTSPQPANITGGIDWAHVPGHDGYLYRVANNAAGNPVLLEFDKQTGVTTNLGRVSGAAGFTTNAGAVYADADGFLYASVNETGRIYRIDVANRTGVLFANGPSSGNNDGARCAISPIALDYGDAPDTYGTTLANDGARHVILGFDEAAGTSSLLLGSSIDYEDDGQPGAGADGDDTSGPFADEDGVSADIIAVPGSETTVVVTATNTTGSDATLAGWIDLNADGVFTEDERQTVVVPAGTVDGQLTLTFPTVTTLDDTFARFRLFAAGVSTFLPTGAATGGEVEDYPVIVMDRQIELEKTSTATEASRIGDTVTYTVTITNPGTDAYTDENPAYVYDDLGNVLDDATLDEASLQAVSSEGTEVAAPTLRDGRYLQWQGPVAAGGTVTLTYQVTLAAGGDGEATNVVWSPPSPPEELVTPDCEDTDLPCDSVTNRFPRVTVEKTSDVTELPQDGGVVTYTVTIRNAGAGAVTPEDEPVVDDLSDVLDDGTLDESSVTASTGTAVFDEGAGELRWNGALAAGEEATVQYSVTYDAKSGDHVLRNVVCLDESLAADPANPCATATVPGIGLDEWKSVEASSDPVAAGTVLTYTLHFRNTGEIPAAVDAVDELVHVLDDADVTAEPSAEGLDVVRDGSQIAVTGVVPVGETRTVTYQVTVRPDGERGDDISANYLAKPGFVPPTTPVCEPADTELPDCTTTSIAAVSYEKSVTASADPIRSGTVLTYQITIRSTGTATTPVAIEDVLTGVLDDADILSEPVSDTDTVSVSSIQDGRFVIGGTLAAGETAIVTYEVVVKAESERGDNRAENVLVTPGEVPGDCVEGDPLCTATDLPEIIVEKSGTPASGERVRAGETVVYTLTFRNDGTAVGAVDHVDDLSDVLDDADLSGEPVVSDAALAAVADGERIVITGPLEPGAVVTVTYEVVVREDAERGNDILANVVAWEDTEEVDCEAAGVSCTTHPVEEIATAKSVDPASGTEVTEGQTLTYTLSFENVGSVPAAVAHTDHLAGVLDDAVLVDGPAASEGLAAAFDGAVISVTGELAPGASGTVTYQVTVKAYAEQGDHVLGNFLTAPGEEVPEVCEEGDANCTTNPVDPGAPEITVIKTADPASGEVVEAGQDVTYTLEFRNDSNLPGPVDFSDRLAGVLDDAELTGTPVVSDDAIAAEVNGDVLYVTGALDAGESATVTYRVTVRADGERGDNVLANVVAPRGVTNPDCDADGVACTTHYSGDLVASKTVDPASGTAVEEGQDLTYTLTFQNVGQGTAEVDYTDDMSGVLDDADLIVAPVAQGGVTVDLDRDALRVTGELAPGATATVTYTVKVKAYSSQADHVLGNFLGVTGEETPDECADGSVLCTSNTVTPPDAPLSATGLGLGAGGIAAALLLLGAGAFILIAVRRRKAETLG